MAKKIITIEREYASGGSIIGKKLSEQLQIPVYGNEILELVAERMGTTSSQIEHLEESGNNSFMYSIAMMTQLALGETDGLSKESELYLEEARIIKELADQGSCIIIGRCAGWILRNREDVLTVFVHADMQERKKRAVEEYGCSTEKLEAFLKHQDKKRASFYAVNARRAWDDRHGYEMMLDSGKLGIDMCVKILKAAIE